MTRKIFRSILSVSLAVLFLCLAGILSILYLSFTNLQIRELNIEADLVAGVLNTQPQIDAADFLLDSSRISILSSEGIVLYDSSKEADSGSHQDREEFQQALQTGTGSASRYSDTLQERTLYVARRLENGNVLRISVSSSSVFGLLVQLFWPILLLVLAAAGLAGWLARSLSRAIAEPVNAIDPSAPFQQPVDPQLHPLLVKLDEYQKENRKQLADLKEKSMEFETLAASMPEGLALISRHDRILLANDAAASTFSLCRKTKLTSSDLLELTAAARKEGKASRSYSLQGMELLAEACRIDPDREHSRVILLIIDVTEKVLSERRRQEFTANVTHELKTPLQTILSSAELLESGMVRKEDEQKFLKYIVQESHHMNEMIQDILLLSRLDEGIQEPQTWISLPETIQNILQRYQKDIQHQHLQVHEQIEGRKILTESKAVQDILSNLISNAVKYSRPYGTIDLSAWLQAESNGMVLHLQVQDNGIGIAPGKQSRIFERFFRADASRSQTIQGTGLGLSIVKHRADQLHGKVSVSSVLQEGSIFSVEFPVKGVKDQAEAAGEIPE